MTPGYAGSSMASAATPAKQSAPPMQMGNGPMKMGDGPMKMGDGPMMMGDGPMKMGDGPMTMGDGHTHTHVHPTKPPAPKPTGPLFVQGGFPNSTKCTNPKIRKEWRRLTKDEQLEWIRAVTCMHNKPPKFKGYFNAIQHRYDDFVAMHINATGSDPGTHNNGFFLVFHRYLLWVWENVLQAECGYNGVTPWWDSSLDSPERGGRFNSSPVFDPVYGFGGDGFWYPGSVRSRNRRMRCLTNGPWKDTKIRLVPEDMQDGTEVIRCIERDFDSAFGDSSGSPSKTLNGILAQDKYEDFSELDLPAGGFQEDRGGPHAIGHLAVGGEMADVFSSTNDPLFWVHHGGIDQFWYRWQGRNKTRLQDIHRTYIENHREGQPLPDGIVENEYTSLDTPIHMVGEFAPVIKIRQIMDTLNENGEGFLCYKYDA